MPLFQKHTRREVQEGTKGAGLGPTEANEELEQEQETPPGISDTQKLLLAKEVDC